MDKSLKTDIISRPTYYFNGPLDVLESKALNQTQKKKALINWKDLCIQKSEAAEEGMRWIQTEEIIRVNSALRQLSYRQ